ncbi:MAG TPA: hypothetical protein VJ044_17665 [Candidatus Hodarchaeales archaeon]|nr:hypothetical protein [Candidatus Hodarchaeales archaeon]
MNQDQRGESFVASGSPLTNVPLLGKYAVLISLTNDEESIIGIQNQIFMDERLLADEVVALMGFADNRLLDLLRNV